MLISYQGIPGAYGHLTALNVAQQLHIDPEQVKEHPTFKEVWESVNEDTLAVVPIENSRAGSIHENLYNFMHYDCKIIGEVNTEVRHALLSLEESIDAVHTAYSHPQALSQCYSFLKRHHIAPMDYFDTAGAAKYIATSSQKGVAAVASQEAGKLYNLNVLQENIHDQEGNATRFFVLAHKDATIDYPEKKGKMTVLFQARDIPASLYKCLGAFATNTINLTKIESIPSFQDPFMYTFRLEFQGKSTNDAVQKSLDELTFFTKSIQVLGEY